MAADKMDDAMMGAAKAVPRQDGIGFGDEVAIGKKQQLDALPDLVLAGMRLGAQFYVRHIDLSRNLV
jgi:hypothetical protein